MSALEVCISREPITHSTLSRRYSRSLIRAILSFCGVTERQKETDSDDALNLLSNYELQDQLQLETLRTLPTRRLQIGQATHLLLLCFLSLCGLLFKSNSVKRPWGPVINASSTKGVKAYPSCFPCLIHHPGAELASIYCTPEGRLSRCVFEWYFFV